MFKPKATQATRDQTRVASRNTLSENLRKQRLANEDSRKAVGLWGELSVVTIEHNGSAFVHLSKGSKHNDYINLSQKRPSEISKQEHALLSDWLRRRRYEGFSSTINAWNLSLEEAQRIKAGIISDLVSTGRVVINQSV